MRAVLIPVKAFDQAKLRLAPSLSPTEREQLARDLAATVVRAAKSTPVFVACDDGRVADWAVSVGAFVLWTPGLGLSGVVTESVKHISSKGYSIVTVAHSDLALIQSLEHFGDEGVVCIAPDRHLDGTNVLSVPASAGFQFAYGPGSYERHRAEAMRLSLPLHATHDWSFAADVDTPEDLAIVRAELERRAEEPLPMI